MGVLEDAIREHLELKRAHGASDEELEREETEALGPARQAAQDESEESAAEAAEADGQEAEPVFDAESAPVESQVDEPPAALDISEPPAADPEPALDAEPAAVEPEPAPEAFTEPADPMSEPAPAPEPEPVVEPEPEPDSIAFDEEEPGVAPPMPDAGDADEDVLEDTPEFLQDTPDHDRLWFEQKPPRDFDFD